MQEASDMELLREYVRRNSDEAFAALVARHVNLVYSAALRKTRNPRAAEEITQAVFVILAKKADRLRPQTILPGWLYQTARFTAAGFLRTEIRRARREQEAGMQSLSSETEPGIWPQIMPLLEDAMGRLGEKERDAVLLRFFEGKSFQEIGAAVGASENAAKKRVGYALEKLRKFFAKRGVSSTTAILASEISAHSVQATPVALAKAVTAVAVAKGAAASASTLNLIQGALKLMAWTKAKTVAVVGVGVLLAVGTATVIVERSNTPHPAEARAFYDSAMKHYMAREYEAEFADLNRAIRLDPKCADGDALFNRACLYSGDWPIKEKDQAKAAADYCRLLDFKPTDVSARHNRALCYEQLRQYDKAIADYTAIIEGNMDFSRLVDGKDKQLALDYHYRGRAYQWYKKDYAMAIADYDEALRLDPKIDMVHQHRGECYQVLKQFDKAKEDFALEKAR